MIKETLSPDERMIIGSDGSPFSSDLSHLPGISLPLLPNPFPTPFPFDLIYGRSMAIIHGFVPRRQLHSRNSDRIGILGRPTGNTKCNYQPDGCARQLQRERDFCWARCGHLGTNPFARTATANNCPNVRLTWQIDDDGFVVRPVDSQLFSSRLYGTMDLFR